MKRWLCASLALLFYASILPWANAEPFKHSLGSGSTVRGTDGTDYDFSDLFNSSSSYSRTIRPGDVIARGPWVDVRLYLPVGHVTDGSVDYSAQVQLALDNLSSGGTLVIPIAVGVGYAGWGNLTISNKTNISILGLNGGGLKVLALPSDDDYINANLCTSCYYPVIYVKHSSNINISNLRFNMNNISGFFAPTTVIPNAIFFDNVTNSKVSGNKFYGSVEAGIGLVSSFRSKNNTYSYNEFTGGGIGLMNGFGSAGYIDNGLIIIGNVFHDMTHSDIQSIIGKSTITGNIFDNSSASINLAGNVDITNNVTISGNSFSGCVTAYRDDVTSGSKMGKIVFQGNTVDNATNGFFATHLKDLVISNNVFNVTGYGINIHTSDNIVISGNIVTGNGSNTVPGIGTNGSIGNLTITGNRVYGFNGAASNAGIYLNNNTEPSGGYTIIEGNYSYGNGIGLFLYSGTDNVVVSNNVFYNNTTDFRSDVVTQVYGLNNIYSTSDLTAGPALKYRVGSKSFSYGSAAPTDNTIACAVGDIVWNTAANNVLGWKCTIAGSPGTWKYMQVTLEP